MATILVNLATLPSQGGARHVTYNGRRYIVSPLSLIVPGVLPGSMGALLYPPDEISRNIRQWERIPLTLYHPTDPITNGHLSAREPNVLRRQGIGFVSRPHMNGKLSAEGWFDVEKLRQADRSYGTNVLNRLEAGEKIELSTGLYTDNEEAENGATCPATGRPYTHIARNYRADHVAVLPDQMGACSVSDGCGVNNANPEGVNQYSKGATNARSASKTASDYSQTLGRFADSKGGNKSEIASEYAHPAFSAQKNSAAAVRVGRSGDVKLASQYHKSAALEHEDAAEAHRNYSGGDSRHEEAAQLHDRAAKMHWGMGKGLDKTLANNSGDPDCPT